MQKTKLRGQELLKARMKNRGELMPWDPPPKADTRPKRGQPRTERSEALERARHLAVVLIDSLCSFSDVPAQARRDVVLGVQNLVEIVEWKFQLAFVVDELVEAFPLFRARAAQRHTEKATFETKWRKEVSDEWRVRRDLARHRRPGERIGLPTDEPKFVRAFLVEALEVIGVLRSDARGWVKGLPRVRAPRRSFMTDFLQVHVVLGAARFAQGVDPAPSKTTVYKRYRAEFAAAKAAGHEGCKGRPFTMTAFAAELRHFPEERTNRVGAPRARTWKGVGLRLQ